MIDIVNLSEVAKINPRPPKDIDETQEVTFLPMAAISENGYVAFEEKRIFSEVKKGFTYFERGDFLIAKITPCFENGKAALTCNIENPIGYGSTEFHVIRPIPEKLDKNYLYYLLWSEPFRFYGKNKMRGAAGQKRVTTDLLKDYKIPLPPINEQKRIAAILDKADAIRRKRRQAIDLTDQFLHSVFLDMFGDPVTNPKGWEVRQLENACVKKAGVKAGPFGSALKKEYYTESGYRIYGQEQVIAGTLKVGDYYIDEAKYLKLESCSVMNGDMLISLVGSIGKTLVVPNEFEPGIINPRLVRVRPNKGLLLSEYLQQLFKQSRFQSQLSSHSHGGTMPILNAGILKSLNIQLPPLELQAEFISILKIIEGKMNKFLSAQRLNEDLFSSLAKHAFQGELTNQTEAA